MLVKKEISRLKKLIKSFNFKFLLTSNSTPRLNKVNSTPRAGADTINLITKYLLKVKIVINAELTGSVVKRQSH